MDKFCKRHFFCQGQTCFVIQMQMRDMFGCVFFADLPILKTNGTRIGSVVKTCFNPITAQDVITIFSQPVTEQLGDKDLVFSIFRFDTQDCPIWRRVNFMGDVLKNGLGEFDYFSKMS